jgi:hypothetical protein
MFGSFLPSLWPREPALLCNQVPQMAGPSVFEQDRKRAKVSLHQARSQPEKLARAYQNTGFDTHRATQKLELKDRDLLLANQTAFDTPAAVSGDSHGRGEVSEACSSRSLSTARCLCRHRASRDPPRLRPSPSPSWLCPSQCPLPARKTSAAPALVGSASARFWARSIVLKTPC